MFVVRQTGPRGLRSSYSIASDNLGESGSIVKVTLPLITVAIGSYLLIILVPCGPVADKAARA